MHERVERAVLVAATRLPETVQRRLGGRPLQRDGLTLSAETQLALRLQQVGRLPSAASLPLEAGRAQTERDARLAGGTQPIGEVRDLTAAGRPARLYVPTGAAPTTPLLVFVHGGGFIFGSIDSHDPACRVLAERAGVRILSVDYRLAPEHPFPAAYDDVLAAYTWALDHAAELGTERTRIGIGGDSAGGNLSAAVARTAAVDGLPCAGQLLLYPATLAEHDTRSAELFGGLGLYLTDEYMDRARDSYASSPADLTDPRFAPGLATSVPAGLAPAYVVTAGFDPLRDEGEAYAALLAAAGVPVVRHRVADQMHGFINIVGGGRRTREAVESVADGLARLLKP